ncbi:MAG: hypothetical protein E7Z89_05700 [Cyanobacteria bacterium SIG28]|nr:hypothetical protein [Cyanobacteria bacterium SIG28]
MIINGKIVDFRQLAEELNLEDLQLGNDKELLSIFSQFDDGDKKLNKKELEKIFNVFQSLDNQDDGYEGLLTRGELEVGATKLGTNRNVLIKFIEKVTGANTKFLASSIVNQIKDASWFRNTEKVLSKINKNNVMDIIDEYDKQTNESLVDGIDQEAFLDINDVKKYICKPLADCAKEFGIEFDYENIDDLSALKSLINKTKEDIKTKTSNVCQTVVTEENGYIHEKEIINFNGKRTEAELIKDENGKLLTDTLTSYTESESGVVTVATKKISYFKNNYKELNLSYQYSQTGIEDYIIKNSYGNKFKNIRALKSKDPASCTQEEQKLIKQFDDLIKYVIEVGNEYGVDPNFIVAIIHQETTFDGMSERVTGNSGKGYMQVTGAPIRNYLGCTKADYKNNIYVYKEKYKDQIYGHEMKELLKSRGFDPDKATNDKEKERLAKDILNYLIKNKDADFNIRLGALILRDYQNDITNDNGNIKETAFDYNGNPVLQDKYSREVRDYYNTIRKDSIPEEERVDTTYKHTINKYDKILKE